MQESKIYRLFSPCIIVRGWLRSLIVDLNRHQSFYIPNTMADVLKYGYNRTWKDVLIHYGADNRNVLESYYEYLNQKELIFELEKNECRRFQRFPLTWDFPSFCSNAIVDWGEDAKYDIKKTLHLLSEFNCYHLQIRFFKDIGIKEVEELLLICEKLDFNTIQLAFSFNRTVELEYERLFDKCWKLVKVEVFSAPYNKLIPKMDGICLLGFYNTKILNVQNCGCVSTDYFVVETNHFTESQCHNTCLNRKVCIDAEGNIKNCPAMAKSYGNINDTTLEEAVNKPGFKDLWYICKDKIDVCKDCEFRHICTDCRAFIKDPENIYSQPAKCTYNPYICKWQGEEGYVPVEECGTYSRETGFVPDKKKIKALNKKIWGED